MDKPPKPPQKQCKQANNQAVYAVFGGTFDPPHYGHLKPLQQVLDIFELGHIGLMPANQPALKGNVTSIQHRLEMTKLLCELDNRLTLDTTEILNGGKTYTIETLIQLKHERPNESLMFVIGLDSLRNIDKWYRWKELFDYAHIVVMCRDIEKPQLDSTSNNSEGATAKMGKTKLASYLYNFYTGERHFDTLAGPEMDESARSLLLSKLALNEANLSGINSAKIMDIILHSVEGKLWFINNNLVSISSTQIRQLIKQGQDVRDYLPETILNHIVKYNLYL